MGTPLIENIRYRNTADTGSTRLLDFLTSFSHHMCHTVHVCFSAAPLATSNSVSGVWEEWPCCDWLLFRSLSQRERLTPVNTGLMCSIIHLCCSLSRGWVTDTDRWCKKYKQEDSTFTKRVRMWFSTLYASKFGCSGITKYIHKLLICQLHFADCCLDIKKKTT